jgi:phosphate regulon transcriptional regulator PhoB
MPKNILVVDDEKDVLDLIAYHLEKEGFTVIKSCDGDHALDMVKLHKPDLMILDLMLPGIQGLDVCRIVRTQSDTQWIPIIMLTAKSEDVDRILGLEMGADDYVTKPFNTRELVARVRAVLRRSERGRMMDEAEQDILEYKGLRINYTSYEVSVDDLPVELRPSEFKLLCFMSRHPGRVYSRDQLLDNIWKDEVFVEPRTIDVNISRLRNVIEHDKDNPQYILTVRGIGYKFTDMK